MYAPSPAFYSKLVALLVVWSSLVGSGGREGEERRGREGGEREGGREGGRGEGGEG